MILRERKTDDDERLWHHTNIAYAMHANEIKSVWRTRKPPSSSLSGIHACLHVTYTCGVTQIAHMRSRGVYARNVVVVVTHQKECALRACLRSCARNAQRDTHHTRKQQQQQTPIPRFCEIHMRVCGCADCKWGERRNMHATVLAVVCMLVSSRMIACSAVLRAIRCLCTVSAAFSISNQK